MTNVLLYCTQPILAEGFGAIVKGLDDFQLIDCCLSADSLNETTKTSRPDLLWVEVTPEVTLDLLQELTAASNGGRIVLWIDSASPEFLSQALGMGVRGLLRKDQSIATYGQCLQRVAAGEVWLDQELAARLLSRRQVHLSERERQLIGLVSQGLKNKEIAYSLGITEGTVKVYLSRLFTKVGANDRFDLALIGLRNVEANPRNALNRISAKPADRAVPFMIPSFLSTERISSAA